KMVKEAEANAAEDKKRKKLVEARNHADSLIYSTEKNLSEHGGKIGAAEKEAIERDLAGLKEALSGEDADAIEAKTQTLMASAMKLGEALYKASQDAAATSGEAPPTAEKGETILDADYEEVKDDDKKN